MFYGVQKGAIEALNTSKDWFDNLNTTYKKRRDLVWKLASQLGCTYDKNTTGMFVWAKLPNDLDSEESNITVISDSFTSSSDVLTSSSDSFEFKTPPEPSNLFSRIKSFFQ